MATILELDDEQAYEAEVSQCVGTTGYHHWFFLSALADALGYEFRAFAVDSGGERLGVVPLLFRRSGPVSTANFLPVGCIGPLIRGEALRAGRIGELLLGAEEALRRNRTVAARLAFSPGLHLTPEDLAIPKYEAFEWENFVMPAAKSVDDIWKSMSTGRRQSVRQTEKRGVTVSDSLPEEITEWFPGEMTSLYEREGRILAYNLAVVQSLARRLAGHPRMLWRTAKGEDGTLYGMTASIIGEDLFRFRPSAAYKTATALRNWGPVRDN